MKNLARTSEDHAGSYKGLRLSVGVIGLLLPIILIIAGLTLEDGFEESISHFFYTPFYGSIFVGSLCAIGIFLGSYRGYKPQDDEAISDRTLGLIAGVAVIVVAIFPTDGFWGPGTDGGLVGKLHFAAAAVFFAAIGGFSYYKFVRTGTPTDELTQDKINRNRVYRACGLTIFLCIAAIGVIKLFKVTMPIDTWMFWLESIAVWAFGISWIVKGEAIEYAQSIFGGKTASQ